MTERAHDKSKDCRRVISELERFTWEGLMHAFQIQDNFVHQGVLDFHGTMDKADKPVG